MEIVMDWFVGLSLQVAIAGLILFVVLRMVQRSRGDAASSTPAVLVPDADRGLAVPVRRLMHTASLWGEHSNLAPRLWIAKDRLIFKVVRKVQALPFDAIRQVEVTTPPLAGGVRILFATAHWSTLPLQGHGLIADLFDAGAAQAALRALPPGIALTPAARVLRDGLAGSGAAAGTT